MDNCFVKMNEIRNSLPNTEKKVIDAILENPRKVCLFTVTELAKYSKSSPATITRMCKSLGYSGYKEFNKKLILDLSEEEKKEENQDGFLEVHQGDSIEEIINKVCLDNMLAIKNTQSILNNGEIMKAVEAIEKSDKLYFYGLGGSALAAQDGAYKFIRLGKSTNAFVSFHDQLYSVKSLTKKDVAVIFSYSGETEAIIEVAKLLKDNHIKTISITRFSNNRLSDICDIPIKITAIGSSVRLVSSGAHIAQLNMLDIIYSIVASKSMKKLQDLHNDINSIIFSDKFKNDFKI